jgi:hypothetical protein
MTAEERRAIRMAPAANPPQAIMLGCGIAAAGLVALLATDVTVAAIVVAIAIAGILTLRMPHWCLAVALALSAAGGNASLLSGIALAIAIGAGTVSLIVAIWAKRFALPVALVVPVLLLVWLLVRYTVEGTDLTARTIAACLALVPLALETARRGHALRPIITMAGAIFIALSAAAPLFIAQSARFDGISGNPNRMVFALLVFLPFVLSLVAERTRAVRAAGLILSLSAMVMIVLSGSSQGLIGLAVISLCLAIASTRGWELSRRRMANAVITMALIGGALAALGAVEWSEDMLTLSARTPLFAAAFEDFLLHPWIGSGLDSVSHGDVVERSAHSVPLALAASGGALAGGAWLGVVAFLVLVGARWTFSGNLLGAALLAVVVVQFVQTVQFLLLTWMIITFVAERGGAHRSGSARERAPSHG